MFAPRSFSCADKNSDTTRNDSDFNGAIKSFRCLGGDFYLWLLGEIITDILRIKAIRLFFTYTEIGALNLYQPD